MLALFAIAVDAALEFQLQPPEYEMRVYFVGWSLKTALWPEVVIRLVVEPVEV